MQKRAVSCGPFCFQILVFRLRAIRGRAAFVFVIYQIDHIKDIYSQVAVDIGRIHIQRDRSAFVLIVNQIDDIKDIDQFVIVDVAADKKAGIADTITVIVGLVRVRHKGTVVITIDSSTAGAGIVSVGTIIVTVI